jgi:hypothetical protein
MDMRRGGIGRLWKARKTVCIAARAWQILAYAHIGEGGVLHCGARVADSGVGVRRDDRRREVFESIQEWAFLMGVRVCSGCKMAVRGDGACRGVPGAKGGVEASL